MKERENQIFKIKYYFIELSCALHMMKYKFVSRSKCVQMEPSFRPSDSRIGRVASLEWPPVWCLLQRLRCQNQYREVLKL